MSAIDLSRVPPPAAIETLDADRLRADFKRRFVAAWAELRLARPDLPQYSVEDLETDPVIAVERAWSGQRLLDRARVNDALKAALVLVSTGTDLDNLVARNDVVRLAGETDDRLRARYLLSFDGRAAGSRQRYLYELLTAVPAIPLGLASVVGYREHGRRGDVDIVAAGPGGRDLTDPEMATARAAVLADHVVPEATAASLLRARRIEYRVLQRVRIPEGPSPEIVRTEVEARVRRVTDAATTIGGLVVRDFVAGAAAGASIVSAVTLEPATDIAADPYSVPVCTGIRIEVEP